MMLTAAAVLPLLGMAGAAFDVSRVFLIKVRLQHACDAGVLAYRRSMNGTNHDDTNAPTSNKSIANNFFNANFTPHRYGSGDPAATWSVDSQVVVHGIANVTVPMAVMQVFGFKQASLQATCNAQLQLPNTDVMFVLDTTGSMTDTNPGDSTNKITALRSAVMSFYATLEAAKIAGTQVRYGFVPYSDTVNVGMLLNRNWVADAATYQSRVWAGQTSTTTTGTTSPTITTSTPYSPVTVSSQIITTGDPENCVAPADTYTSKTTSSAWTPDATTLPHSRTDTFTQQGSKYTAAAQADGTCKITETRYPNQTQTRTTTVDKNPNANQNTNTTSYTNNWTYQQVTYDVSALKGSLGTGLMAGGTFNAYINNPASNPSLLPAAQAISWSGSSACIEERKTLRPGETGVAGEPYDENIDLIPDTSKPETQWKPMLPRLVFARNVTGGYTGASAAGWAWSYAPTTTSTTYVNMSSYPNDRAVCPSAARKLMSKEQGLTTAVLQSYMNGLRTGGDTYHDIGFLWGVRLASAQGLFATENATAPNGFDIARNIIFMTDGTTESHIQDYEAYGLSALDRRRTANPSGHLPTDSEQDTIVENRLSQYCSAAKSKGMTVWVIAFGTSLTSLLSNCATSGRAYQANNSTDLNNAFADIASRIAQLRLTQ